MEKGKRAPPRGNYRFTNSNIVVLSNMSAYRQEIKILEM